MVDINLPVVGESNNIWGGQLNAALELLANTLDDTVIDIQVQEIEGEPHLVAIRTDGDETDLGALPPGPAGPPGGSDEETAERIESGPLTQAALKAQFVTAVVDGDDITLYQNGVAL